MFKIAWATANDSDAASRLSTFLRQRRRSTSRCGSMWRWASASRSCKEGGGRREEGGGRREEGEE
jgi:hypothetical protein